MLIPTSTHSASTQSFLSASKEFDDVCRWLSNIGIGVSQTRIGRYKRIIADLPENFDQISIEQFLKKYSRSDFLNAVVETAQIIRIFKAFNETNDPGLVDRLKKAVRGHALFVMDNENRSGRDFSLELDIAAKFAQAGYHINFEHDADVSTYLNNFPIYIECKRLKSENKIRQNIKDGLKQLKNRYISSDNPITSRGLLVLSIGKLVNPNFGYVEGAGSVEIGEICSNYSTNFINKYEQYWIYENIDNRSLGVVILLDAPGRTTDPIIPFSIHDVVVTNIVPSLSKDFEILMELMQVFKTRT